MREILGHIFYTFVPVGRIDRFIWLELNRLAATAFSVACGSIQEKFPNLEFPPNSQCRCWG